MKQTALYPVHKQRAAKMAEFRRWTMPVQFSDPADERHAVRASDGLFHAGFLGRIEIAGSGAEALVQALFTRNVAALSEGSAKYGLLCNKQGQILDNVLLFMRSGYNTSDRVLEPLSDVVRRVVDQAIESARREGRMTVLDRDVPEL